MLGCRSIRNIYMQKRASFLFHWIRCFRFDVIFSNPILITIYTHTSVGSGITFVSVPLMLLLLCTNEDYCVLLLLYTAVPFVTISEAVISGENKNQKKSQSAQIVYCVVYEYIKRNDKKSTITTTNAYQMNTKSNSTGWREKETKSYYFGREKQQWTQTPHSSAEQKTINWLKMNPIHTIRQTDFEICSFFLFSSNVIWFFV